MQAEVAFIRPSLVSDGRDGYWLRCDCGAVMRATWGKRLVDGEEAEFLWHVCEREPAHITQEIWVSRSFRSAFTAGG